MTVSGVVDPGTGLVIAGEDGSPAEAGVLDPALARALVPVPTLDLAPAPHVTSGESTLEARAVANLLGARAGLGLRPAPRLAPPSVPPPDLARGRPSESPRSARLNPKNPQPRTGPDPLRRNNQIPRTRPRKGIIRPQKLSRLNEITLLTKSRPKLNRQSKSILSNLPQGIARRRPLATIRQPRKRRARPWLVTLQAMIWRVPTMRKWKVDRIYETQIKLALVG